MQQIITKPAGQPLRRHPESPRGAQAIITRVFVGREGDDFSALRDAEMYLHTRGFSFGRSCFGTPSGVMFGRWLIAKWRNLTGSEIRALHGEISGDFRSGPVTVAIYATAPIAAIEAAALPAFTLTLKDHGTGVVP